MIINATYLFFNKGYKTKNRVLQLIVGQNNIIDVWLWLITVVAVDSYLLLAMNWKSCILPS